MSVPLTERVKILVNFDLIFKLLDAFLSFANAGRRRTPSAGDFDVISRPFDFGETSFICAFPIKSLILSTLRGSTATTSRSVMARSSSVHDTPQQLLNILALSVPSEYDAISDTIIDAIRSGPSPTKPWSSPVTASARPTGNLCVRKRSSPFRIKHRIVKSEFDAADVVLFFCVRVREVLVVRVWAKEVRVVREWAKEGLLDVETVFSRSNSGLSGKNTASLRLRKSFIWTCLLSKAVSPMFDPVSKRAVGSR